jgi:preprotein translocase subunit SecG
MLSFIREKGHGEPSGQEPPRPRRVGRTPPNGAGDLKRDEVQGPCLETHEETQGQGCPQTQENALGTQQEYLTVAARDKKNVRRSTILLGGLFILGLLCLWFMIKKSSPQTATASSGKVSTEEAQIETAIAQLTGVRSEMFTRMGEIVKKFYEFSDVQQVKVDSLHAQPLQAALAGGQRSGVAGVVREDLRDEEDAVAPPRDRVGDDRLRNARRRPAADQQDGEEDGRRDERQRRARPHRRGRRYRMCAHRKIPFLCVSSASARTGRSRDSWRRSPPVSRPGPRRAGG